MRTRLLATVALLSLSTAAFAADLPSRRAPAPYVVVPVFTWTGFYIGGNVGGGSGNYSTQNIGNNAAAAANVGTTRPTFFRTNQTGFTGGGQVGYNYQIGQFVIGVEADASYTDFAKTRSITLAGATDSIRDDLKYLGTVRGRVGYAFDRIMVYGTGGFAYGDVYNREFLGSSAAPVLNANSGARYDTKTGYAYGGGIEYAIPTGSFFSFLNFFNTSAVTIKAEYLHYDLGRNTYTLTNAAGAQNFTARTRDSGDIGRLGVNYKF